MKQPTGLRGHTCTQGDCTKPAVCLRLRSSVGSTWNRHILRLAGAEPTCGKQWRGDLAGSGHHEQEGTPGRGRSKSARVTERAPN
jgi:hypothetical protein